MSHIQQSDRIADRLEQLAYDVRCGRYTTGTGHIDLAAIIAAATRVVSESTDPYGRCPHCGGECKARERRLNGNDTCENGHVYPSSAAVR